MDPRRRVHLIWNLDMDFEPYTGTIYWTKAGKALYNGIVGRTYLISSLWT